MLQRMAVGGVAQLPGKAGLVGMVLTGRIETHDLVCLIHNQQPAADVHCGGAQHLAAFQQRQLGRAAADIDIQHALAQIMRGARRAGSIGGEHRFHMVSGRGTDEFAALVGQQVRNGLRVLAPQRFAGENHGAGIDLVRMQAGRVIGLVNDRPERTLVDAGLALIRSERNRRLVQRLARHH